MTPCRPAGPPPPVAICWQAISPSRADCSPRRWTIFRLDWPGCCMRACRITPLQTRLQARLTQVDPADDKSP